MIREEYRLKDYIIAEYDNHFYTWEMNVVLGEHRTGSCFIIGDILVFHSLGIMKNGCLKLEYTEKLAPLPVWSKTRYYCFSDSLKDVKKGTILSNGLDQTTVEKYRPGAKSPVKKGEYHLGLYKIRVNSGEDIFWEKYDGLNKINKGACIIISGLLFLQSEFSSNDSMQSRREWSSELKSLPKWEITPAWGHLKVLKTCNQNKEIKIFRSNLSDLGPPHSAAAILQSDRSAEEREPFFKLPMNTPERVTQLRKYLFLKKEGGQVFPRLNTAVHISFSLVSGLLRKIIYGINKTGAYILRHKK